MKLQLNWEEMCVGDLSACTKADCTSCFKGKGKTFGFCFLQNNEVFAAAMATLGQSFNASDQVMQACEAATCTLYCFNPKTNNMKMTFDVNNLRSILLKSGMLNPEELLPSQVYDMHKHVRVESSTLDPITPWSMMDSQGQHH